MDVSDWFDLKNYPPSKDPIFWADQIALRLIAQQWIFNVAADPESAFVDIIFDNPHQFDDLIHDDPEYRPAREVIFRDLEYIRNWPEESEDWQRLREEKERLEKDYYRDYAKFRRGEKLSPEGLRIKERLKEIESTPTMDIDDNGDAGGLGVPFDGGLGVIIDLSHDDKSIMKGVAAAITSVRERHDVVPIQDRPLSERDFANWFSSGVLPYYDLRLWENITDQPLTYEEQANLIWPMGPGNAETLRKTARRHARMIFNTKTVERLRSLTD
jgi:hypothetical protein